MTGAEQTPQAMVREFHEKFGLPIADKPSWPDNDLALLRWRLLVEEFGELRDADDGRCLAEFADALGDIAYVLYGTALTYGIDLDAVLAEIHRSNMSKLGADGRPVLREDGKVIKGPSYEEPDLHRVLFGEVDHG